jgi:adenosine deaminase
MRFYYDQGIRVTLNTDNRLMSDTTLTKEFGLARDLFGFTLHDFREVTIIAMKAAFLSHVVRKEMIKNIAEEFETDFGIMPEYIEQK